MNEEPIMERTTKALREQWYINDEISYDTLLGASVDFEVSFQGVTSTVRGRLGFRHVGPGEFQYVPRLRGVYKPSEPLLEFRLLLDIAPQELHALQVLPEGGFRLRQRSPLQLDALE